MAAIAEGGHRRRPPGDYDVIVENLARCGWSVTPNFFDPHTVQKLRSRARWLHRRGLFHDAGVGRGETLAIRRDVRGDRIVWLDVQRPSPAQDAYLAEMETLRLAINRALYLGLFDFEGHYASYPAGTFYRRHRDGHQEGSRRRVTCITYLNPDWRPDDGGQLRLYTPSEEGEPWRDVPPMGGTLACFLSDAIEHEVLETRVERLSITGWFRTRD